MLLLFSCPCTIPVPSCRPSCHTRCCVPPSSGCAATSLSRLSTAPTTAPTTSCGEEPHSFTIRVGSRDEMSPSVASRPAWKQTPHLAVRDAAADLRARTQAVPPPPSGSRFQTCWFLHLLRCRQATVQEPFFRSRTSFLHAGGALGGSPVETWLHPWLMVKPVGCTVPPLYTPCISAAMYSVIN
jgi:hypothetical protein